MAAFFALQSKKIGVTTMKIDTKNKIVAEIESTKVFENLREEISGYTLKRIFAEDGDKFFYKKKKKKKKHRTLTAYFHEETQEYKARVNIGLTEFCLTKFFTNKLEIFAEILNAEIESTLENLSAPVDTTADVLIADKNFSAWKYPKTLPKNIEGFELFITPDKPAKISNGSYIILNYSNFETACDFTIFYNAYTDNFCGESKINLMPNVSYLFDADNLKDLESKLQKNFVVELSNIKKASINRL